MPVEGGDVVGEKISRVYGTVRQEIAAKRHCEPSDQRQQQKQKNCETGDNSPLDQSAVIQQWGSGRRTSYGCEDGRRGDGRRQRYRAEEKPAAHRIDTAVLPQDK